MYVPGTHPIQWSDLCLWFVMRDGLLLYKQIVFLPSLSERLLEYVIPLNDLIAPLPAQSASLSMLHLFKKHNSHTAMDFFPIEHVPSHFYGIHVGMQKHHVEKQLVKVETSP